jgi:hypothetical protein
MNIVSAAVLAGFAALATVWILALQTSPSAPPPSVVAHRSAFLEDRQVLVAAAGSCQTRTDVGESLLGEGDAGADDPAPVATAPDPALEASTTALEAPTAAPVPESEIATAPIPGTCGTRASPESGDAVLAETIGADADGSNAAATPSETDVAVDRAEPTREAAPAAETEPQLRLAPEPRRRAAPKPVRPPKEPLTAWWPERKADALNVLFVGEAAFGSAISLLTDGQFDSAESANAHIEVRSAGGAVVDRRWQVATNRQMLLMLVEPGVYTVSIKPDFSDAKGRTAGTASSGQVYVR